MDNVELQDTILKALREAAEACTALAGFIMQSAEHLRSGEIREGNELLSKVLNDFSILVSFLEDVRRCTPFPEGTRNDSIDALDHASREMGDLLNTAVGAQENEDWVYLADILEYEFSQKLRSWDGLLKGMAQSREEQTGL
jgi:hypothetical protein